MITVSEIERTRDWREDSDLQKENERFAYENEEYRKSVDVLITSYTEHSKQIDFLNKRVDIILDNIPKEHVNDVIRKVNRIEAGQDRSEEMEQDYGRSI